MGGAVNTLGAPADEATARALAYTLMMTVRAGGQMGGATAAAGCSAPAAAADWLSPVQPAPHRGLSAAAGPLLPRCRRRPAAAHRGRNARHSRPAAVQFEHID